MRLALQLKIATEAMKTPNGVQILNGNPFLQENDFRKKFMKYYMAHHMVPGMNAMNGMNGMNPMGGMNAMNGMNGLNGQAGTQPGGVTSPTNPVRGI